MEITKNTSIEEIVNSSAAAVKYLREKGVKCIACGEPIWGTLGEAADEKDFSPEEVDFIVEELNRIIKQASN